MDWAATFESTITLFAIVNPIGSIPIFIQLTSKMTPPQRRRAFRTGTLSATVLFIAAIGMNLLMEGLSHYFK